jgi:hypothetical protein
MAAFTSVRFLRTGIGGFGGEVAALNDEYLVRVDSQIDKATFLEMWVNYGLTNGVLPIPKITFKALGSRYVVCDYMDADNKGRRYLWSVFIKWKEISEAEGQQQSGPTPTPPPGSPAGSPPSDDPDDWEPKATRRPVTVQVPAESLFYEGGYTGTIHTAYTANTTAKNRSPFTNSAGIPFRDQLPPHQRIQSLWTVRWMQKKVPTGLLSSELKLNENAVTFKLPGHSESWAAKTAKIESVQLTQTRWGNKDAWEVNMEILYDRDGHLISALDQGMTEAYFTGEAIPTPSGSVAATQKELLTIKDYAKRDVVEPVPLDGGGKKLIGTTLKYGSWRDFPLVDFKTVPLLNKLVS